MSRKAIIVGAGPAGLTAAYELLKRTDVLPIILEKSGEIGGISKTVNYKGNRMDIGGHRFFSKSDRVMEWWLNIMPLELGTDTVDINYQNKSRSIQNQTSQTRQSDCDNVMLVRRRISRIYFLRKFFSYPIKLSVDTLKKLGLSRTIGIMLSYIWARLLPRKPEKSLEDFFINRFGKKLYLLFFKDYTEKVWGVACAKIPAEWGAQRIKGISIGKALAHAIKSLYPKGKSGSNNIGQKEMETSLIEKFLYPKFGPGQLWEEVARQVENLGGEIHMHQNVLQIHSAGHSILSIEAMDGQAGDRHLYEGDFFISTMPVQELIAGMDADLPAEVRSIAEGLQYRDFITVGVLLSKLTTEKMLPDTWIYIQERDVKVGRLQIFNNWSPFMVKDPNTIWIGMEYFCNITDDLWKLTDLELKRKAVTELAKMGLAHPQDVLDSVVLRVEKTYPAYFGTYERFGEIRQFTDGFTNLFLVGRNGMHKYNNSDHSMLTAMVAVDNIIAGNVSKANIWAVNTEQEYHEEKAAAKTPAPSQIPSPTTTHQNPNPLWDYIWNNRLNRAWWIGGIFAMLLQLILFKLRYPFANYLPDSYSYLEAAATNADVNMWPVAYSKFLRQVSVFTHSDTAVVAVQYLFMQISGLVFLFSLFYLLKPAKVARNVLILVFVFNPAILYMSNYISADSLFIGFSFLWLSSLLWIVYQPKPWQVVLQACFLLACFTLRYNAIYYPVIAAAAFLLSKYRWYGKLVGIGLTMALVAFSVLFTTEKMREATGRSEFSAFGGWQLANNALYMYQDVPAANRTPVPARFKRLDAMVRQHMDTLGRVRLTKADSVSAHFSVWSPQGPLVQYMMRDWQKDSITPYFKRWASEAPLFMDYGTFLIRKYPWPFIQSVLLPNAARYVVPPAEFLAIYNMGRDSVGSMARDWFNYKSPKVKDHNDVNNRIGVMEWTPALSAIANALLLLGIAGMILFKGFGPDRMLITKFTWLLVLAWISNAGFSILVSPITLRYQLFPVLSGLGLGVILLSTIYQIGVKEAENEKLKLA